MIDERPGARAATRLRVFLVDDHELVRSALAAVMDRRDDFELAGESATVSDAVRDIQEAMPDVVLIDIRLPDSSGLELCKWLRNRFPEMRRVILTAALGEVALSDIVAAGADAYVGKDAPLEELLAAVHEVSHSRHAPAAQRLAVEAAPDDEVLRELTDREYRILELIAEGLTNVQIARRLELAEQTVKNQISVMLRKLGLRSRAQAAVHYTMRRKE